MNMNEKIQKAAASHFVDKIREEVIWISEKSWPRNLGASLNRLNEIIKAGEKFGVTNSVGFTETELASMLDTIHPLRVLGMDAEIKEYLASVLRTAGVTEITVGDHTGTIQL